MVYLFIISFFIIGLALSSPLFMDDWFFREQVYGTGGHAINELSAQLLVWWYIAFSLLNFSLFYLFQNVSNKQKTFYSFVFFYFLMLMLYGHSLFTPYLGKIFLIEETYPYFNWSDNPSIYNYIWISYLDGAVLADGLNLPFDTYFHITISHMWMTKIENGHYLFAILTLLTPHYWINTYCANAMLSTSLVSQTFDPAINNTEGTVGETFWNAHPDAAIKISNFEPIDYVYPKYGFEDAKIWSFQNEIGWVLSMYLWMAYFILFSFIGICISRSKQHSFLSLIKKRKTNLENE